MLQKPSALPSEKSGRVLVADDTRSSRMMIEALLSPEYDVEVAESGADVLQMLPELKPDLVVLDIEMPGLDGYETCRRIRQTSPLPVIFVTAHTTLESELEAFAAGGNDLITKPISQEIFLMKAARAIETHRSAQRLQQEMKSLESMALNYLSSVGETGVLLDFMRSSVQCRSYFELAGRLAEATRALEMQCYGVLRSSQGNQYFRSEGEPTGLEKEILAKVSGMGRVFQFKTQLVANLDHVSVIVTNVPAASPERSGKFRDNLCTLAEAAESLVENVEMRQESMARAEQLQIGLIGASNAVQTLREQHRLMLTDTRILLQELVDSLERSFSWLSTTTEQEQRISHLMNDSVQNILDLLSTRGQFEAEFASVLTALRGPEAESAVDLF